MEKFAGLVAAVACAVAVCAPVPAVAQLSFGFGFGPYGGYHDYHPSRPLYRRHYYDRFRYRHDYGDEVYNFRSGDDHVVRCEAYYRSYNSDTDLFLGYDGEYHHCQL